MNKQIDFFVVLPDIDSINITTIINTSISRAYFRICINLNRIVELRRLIELLIGIRRTHFKDIYVCMRGLKSSRILARNQTKIKTLI